MTTKYINQALSFLDGYIAEYDHGNKAAKELLRDARKELSRIDKLKNDVTTGIQKKIQDAKRDARRDGFYEGMEHQKKLNTTSKHTKRD